MAFIKDLLFGYPYRDTNTNTGILSATLTKVKYTLSILQIYWKYTSKVYLKYTSSILKAYFIYT